MKEKTDYSYGVIPIKNFYGEWKVFLINQYSRIGNNTYWILPKGHAEGDEAAIDAAKRELLEETGMTIERLFDSTTFELKYNFVFDGTKIKKTVVFFVGEIVEDNFTLDPDEVVEAGWYSLEEASDRLDYSNAKQMFKTACDFIKKIPTD